METSGYSPLFNVFPSLLFFVFLLPCTYFPSLLHFFLNCDYVHTFQCHFLLSMLLATISTLTLIGLILILSQQQQLVLSHSYSDTYTTSFYFVSIYLCIYLYSCSACLSFYTSGLLTFDQLLMLLCLLARVYNYTLAFKINSDWTACTP